MRDLWRNLTASGLEFLFPARCVGCGRSGDLLCEACRATLQPLEPPFCDRCGLPLNGGGLCRNCRTALPRIAGIRSAYRFEGAMRPAIHALKYKDVTALARPLARLLVKTAEPLRPYLDIAIAVPLHPRRLRARGYNQAALVLGELGRIIDLPCAENIVQRVRDTPSQVQAGSWEARRENMRGAFGRQDPRVRGQRILLLDDVCTTGSTLIACADSLYAAGAASVRGLTLAREV